jgi:hypothetical protein
VALISMIDSLGTLLEKLTIPFEILSSGLMPGGLG